MSTTNLELIVDDEIKLKQFTVEDVDVIFSLIDRNRAHLSQNIDRTSEKYQSKEDVIDSITHPKNHSRLRFGIWAKNTYVGSINLTSHKDMSAEIGYYLGSEFQGKGYISRSVNRLVKYGFEELLLSKIWAAVHIDNPKSKKVLESCGFAYEKTKGNEFYYSIMHSPTTK